MGNLYEDVDFSVRNSLLLNLFRNAKMKLENIYLLFAYGRDFPDNTPYDNNSQCPADVEW